MNARKIKEQEVEDWMEAERQNREPRYPLRARVSTSNTGNMRTVS